MINVSTFQFCRLFLLWVLLGKFVFADEETTSKAGNLRGTIQKASQGSSGRITEIPRIIFRTNEAGSHKHLHSNFHQIFAQSLDINPGFVQVYFSSSARLAFIEQYYPSYVSLYNKLVPGAYKADLFRLLIIYKYGGIYADSAINFVKTIEGKFIDDLRTDQFVGAVDLDNTAMLNGVFAAYPRHPIIGHMIKWVTNNIIHERYGCNDLDISGPKALGRAFHAYMNFSLTSPLALGKHEKNGYKYHFHQFHITQKVTNSRNEEIMRNKFDGYQDHQYRSQKPYGHIYSLRRVFKTPDLRDNRDILSLNPSTTAYEGSLIKDGMRDDYWLVIRNNRYGFPSKGVFRSMGMEVCTFCSAGYNDITSKIPLAGTLPSNSDGYWEKYWQALPSLDRNAQPLLKETNSDSSSWEKLQDFIMKNKKSTVDAATFLRFMDSETFRNMNNSTNEGMQRPNEANHLSSIKKLLPQHQNQRLRVEPPPPVSPVDSKPTVDPYAVELNPTIIARINALNKQRGNLNSFSPKPNPSIHVNPVSSRGSVVSESLLAHRNRRKSNDPNNNRPMAPNNGRGFYTSARYRGNLALQ